MDEAFFDKLREKVKESMEKGGSHEFSHVARVYKTAILIAKKERADLDIVKAAALLHDIARMREDNKEIACHANEGAKLAEEILDKTDFPKEKIEKVCYAIKVHRHSKGIKAETKEAQILQDADRLDALGAITIARMFSTGGKKEIPLHNPNVPFGEVYPGYKADSTIHAFHAKILKLKPEVFNTEPAKKIAKYRYKFVENFLKEFLAEWEGER